MRDTKQVLARKIKKKIKRQVMEEIGAQDHKVKKGRK